PRVLPNGCHAEIDAGRWDFPRLFARLQEGGNVAPEEMARTFNCGIGMVAIIAAGDAETVVSRLSESGEQAMVIGRVEAGQRGCTVRGLDGSWGSSADWVATHHHG
ncbi:MAG: AIR synthase-related protein, partial [Pseudomonadota bacterium]|nr:AIR synthase-related protein [Pseudomonadota bacterium]